jgi:CRP-like cAMP-binding protein
MGAPLLARLEPDAVERLLTTGRERALPAGGLLIQAGDPSDGFFVVLQGTLEVLAPGGGMTLAELGPGDAVGEMGLASAAPRTADVRSAGPARVWHLSAGAFEALLAVGDPLAPALLRGIGCTLAARFREAVRDSSAMAPGITRRGLGDQLRDQTGWEVE